MFQHTQGIVANAEHAAASGRTADVLPILRSLCLMDFGHLLLTMPDGDYPHLSRVLPRMASDQVQRDWTGASGQHLLHATVDFVRIMQTHFQDIARRPLRDARILDYGCGYGRIARLMYWFTDPENYVGIDPWDKSLELCAQDGLLGQFLMSDYLPATLPVGERKFDLMFAFSVFTHTSLRATQTALAALRKVIDPGGLLVITIRPAEFWPVVARISVEDRQAAADVHRHVGFSFNPAPYPRIDDELIFGDTSIDPGWLAANFPQWKLHRYDRGIDEWQTIMLLTPS